MVFVCLLPGCDLNQRNHLNASANVLYGWHGEFSDDAYKATIANYQENYAHIAINSVDPGTSISFKTDFIPTYAFVSLISPVDDCDPNIELSLYIELFVETEINENKVIVYTDWWNPEENKSSVWAYLVHVKDYEGVVHYYYFRTDYSACVK